MVYLESWAPTRGEVERTRGPLGPVPTEEPPSAVTDLEPGEPPEPAPAAPCAPSPPTGDNSPAPNVSTPQAAPGVDQGEAESDPPAPPTAGRTCKGCGAPLPAHTGPGHPRTWCSERCRKDFEKAAKRTSRGQGHEPDSEPPAEGVQSMEKQSDSHPVSTAPASGPRRRRDDSATVHTVLLAIFTEIDGAQTLGEVQALNRVARLALLESLGQDHN